MKEKTSLKLMIEGSTTLQAFSYRLEWTLSAWLHRHWTELRRRPSMAVRIRPIRHPLRTGDWKGGTVMEAVQKTLLLPVRLASHLFRAEVLVFQPFRALRLLVLSMPRNAVPVFRPSRQPRSGDELMGTNKSVMERIRRGRSTLWSRCPYWKKHGQPA